MVVKLKRDSHAPLSCFIESAQNKGDYFRDTTLGGREFHAGYKDFRPEKSLLSHGRVTRPIQRNEERMREEDWTIAT